MAVNVLLGSCLRHLPSLEPFDLIFADPPFNIGQKYQGFTDRQENFEDWCGQWIRACWDKCQGVLCLHGNDDLADIYLYHARNLGMQRVAWINWHYRFGQCTRKSWIDSRCHCLIYAKDRETYTWNPEYVLVDSDRKSKYKDNRTKDYARGGKRLPHTIWGLPSDGPYWGRVQGNSKERRPQHPNQLPEVYLARLIRAYTNPGDHVLDPFCGSGTTAVVCSALSRLCTTIDISPSNCASAFVRACEGSKRL